MRYAHTEHYRQPGDIVQHRTADTQLCASGITDYIHFGMCTIYRWAESVERIQFRSAGMGKRMLS